jgi:hypothetical protein
MNTKLLLAALAAVLLLAPPSRADEPDQEGGPDEIWWAATPAYPVSEYVTNAEATRRSVEGGAPGVKSSGEAPHRGEAKISHKPSGGAAPVVKAAGGTNNGVGGRVSLEEEKMAALSWVMGQAPNQEAMVNDVMRTFDPRFNSNTATMSPLRYRQVMNRMDGYDPFKQAVEALAGGQTQQEIWANMKSLNDGFSSQAGDITQGDVADLEARLRHYGFDLDKARRTHGFPADSPFNPSNPNSPFFKGAKRDGSSPASGPTPQMIEDQKRHDERFGK